MNWLEVFAAMEATAVGQIIRESLWLFPAIEAVHLLGLGLLGGSILIVDFRLLGIGIRGRPAHLVLIDARPWFLLALATMFATGIPLFLSEAIKCFYNYSFWVKMIALASALVFTFAVRNPLVRREPGRLVAGVLGLVSIGAWFTVAAAGRWIGFSS